MAERDELTGEIVDAALKLHRALGPGLLESVYELLLAKELERRGIRAARQVPVSFEYDGLSFQDVYRIDLLVEDRVIVEMKSVERIAPVHSKQLLTYLRLMNFPVSLLINFGAPTLKEGLRRIVNNRLPLRLCVSLFSLASFSADKAHRHPVAEFRASRAKQTNSPSRSSVQTPQRAPRVFRA